MHSIEMISSYDRFSQLCASWNELLARSDMDCPFMTHEWFSYFWQKFCRKSRPLVLVINDGSRVEGIIPLVRKRVYWRGLPVTSLEFMANYFSIRTGIIAHPDADQANIAEKAFDFLRKYGIGFDLLSANFVVKDSLTDRSLQRLLNERKLRYTAMTGDANPFVRTTATWERYLGERSKHHRFNVRHIFKKYEQGIDYKITTYTGGKLDDAAEKMFYISRNSWKFNAGSAICNDPEKMDFYRSFLDTAAGAGWLAFKIMEINSIPAAFGYELRYKNSGYLLKIGYNNAFRQLSPGVFLVNWMLKQAFSEGLKEYELLGADEDWKTKMTSEQREHRKFWIFNDSPYGRLLFNWESRVVAAAKSFRKRMENNSRFHPAAGTPGKVTVENS